MHSVAWVFPMHPDNHSTQAGAQSPPDGHIKNGTSESPTDVLTTYNVGSWMGTWNRKTGGNPNKEWTFINHNTWS